jgi:hypothetical protein
MWKTINVENQTCFLFVLFRGIFAKNAILENGINYAVDYTFYPPKVQGFEGSKMCHKKAEI